MPDTSVRIATRIARKASATAILVAVITVCPSCFPDKPKPSFTRPTSGQQLDGRVDLQVKTQSLMPCDSVVLYRDGTRAGLFSKSESMTGVWDAACWATGGTGATEFWADAHNLWFSEACTVACNVARPCTVFTSLTVHGTEGSAATWGDIHSFAFTGGHSYDIALWEANLLPQTWQLWAGHWDRNRSWPDTVIATALIQSPGDYFRFTPPSTDTYELGWKSYPGNTGLFLIFDMLPTESQR
jgi:hypothetical protein